MKLATTLLLALLFMTSTLSARTWTQAATGKKIEAEMIKVEGDTVHLRLANGAIGKVKVSALSQADQDFITQQSAGSASSTAVLAERTGLNSGGQT
jgi:hypothetical protein